MKRIFLTALGLSIFFVGLGTIVERSAAKFKSDEKALDIIRKARIAIGGDAAIGEVKALVIKGQTSATISIDGSDRTEQGETEITLQMPDKLMKTVRLGSGEGSPAQIEAIKTFDVVVQDGKGEGASGETKKFVIRMADGGEMKEVEGGETKVFVRKLHGEPGEHKAGEVVQEVDSADGKALTVVRKGAEGEPDTDRHNMLFEKRHGGPERNNELLRTTLSLLLTAPQGTDVSYSYAGDTDLDGTAVSTVAASFGGSSFKLYFDRSSYLPVAVSYTGHAPVMVMMHKPGGDPNAKGDVITFSGKVDGPVEGVETLVRFSDYRATNGIQLPYKWTTSRGGKVADVFDVTSYEVNPTDISERFKGDKVMIRSKMRSQN